MSTSNAGVYQSTNSSTSTLRPRNPRLISYVDDENGESQSEASARSYNSSRSHSPYSQLGDTTSTNIRRAKSVSSGKNSDVGKNYSRATSIGGTASTSNDIWTSWSSISGIASTLLGSDSQSNTKGKSTTRVKQPAWMRQDHSFGIPRSTQNWGPSVDNLSASTQNVIEERQAQIQAKKREALLLASATETRDVNGRFKRRGSDADISGVHKNDLEEDMLVYLHKIKPDDTLAGVMIKYSCQPDVFRKVNRFWPNDSIQTRKYVFLPVEACLVRGKKTNLHDLNLLDDTGLAEVNSHSNSNKDYLSSTASSSSKLDDAVVDSPVSYESFSQTDEGVEFKHDSWVILPSSERPIEILRTNRRTLGHFPRTRRKSNTALTDTSSASTPKTSFDMLRHPPTHAAQTSLSLNASPIRHKTSPRQRSSSNASAAAAAQSSFAAALRGPGGVGTLSGLRTEVSRPGPAPDPLNKKFAQYLPDLTPPQDFPSPGLSLLLTPRLTPRASSDSVRSYRSNSASSGLGEVGGSIEGWVRKFAGVKKDRSGLAGLGGPTKMGDLIELESTSDLGDSHVENITAWDVDGDPTPTATPRIGLTEETDESEVSTPKAIQSQNAFSKAQNNKQNPPTNLSSVGSTSSSNATAREEALLNERFPVRGRVKNAYNMGGVGKDKGD